MRHITKLIIFILSMPAVSAAHKLDCQTAPAVNDPYHYYRTMLANAQISQDPDQQMEQFLAGSWNFLPERKEGQTREKTRIKDLFYQKYKVELAKVSLNLPPSVDWRQLCKPLESKIQQSLEKSYQESQAKLAQELKEQQDQSAKTQAELENVRDTQASIIKISQIFAEVQASLQASYLAYNKLRKELGRPTSDIKEAENNLIKNWDSALEEISRLQKILVQMAGLSDVTIAWRLTFKNEDNIRATVQQLKSLASITI